MKVQISLVDRQGSQKLVVARAGSVQEVVARATRWDDERCRLFDGEGGVADLVAGLWGSIDDRASGTVGARFDRWWVWITMTGANVPDVA